VVVHTTSRNEEEEREGKRKAFFEIVLGRICILFLFDLQRLLPPRHIIFIFYY
jgi:hypothetical protein